MQGREPALLDVIVTLNDFLSTQCCAACFGLRNPPRKVQASQRYFELSTLSRPCCCTCGRKNLLLPDTDRLGGLEIWTVHPVIFETSGECNCALTALEVASLPMKKV